MCYFSPHRIKNRKQVDNISIIFNKLESLLATNGKTFYSLRKDKIVGTETIKKLQQGYGFIDTRTINNLCEYLNCQPGDIMEYVPDNQITKTSHEDNTPADHTHRKAEPGTASRNAFDERREQLLKQYEALTSTAGQEGTKSSSDSQRKKPEPDPDTHPRETLDEKLERLYNEHGPNHPRMTPL